jgi:hypothetical protein
MAASPYDNPGAVVERRQAIEAAERKASALDVWLERIAAEQEKRRAT